MSASALERAVRAHGADRVVAALSDAQRAELRYNWRAIARPEQLAPAGDWRTWLLCTGRGFGKTLALCQLARQEIEAGRAGRAAMVAATAADVRDVLVEGQSGLLAISPPWNRPTYEPSKRRLTYASGAIVTTYSAEESDRLRGPQHDLAICDEIAIWGDAGTWDMLQFGLRLGAHPRCAAATTPRPTRFLRELIADPTTVTVRGSMLENRANLPQSFLDAITKRYSGSRLGRQEIDGELLSDLPGALFLRDQIDRLRLARAPELVQVAIGIDPSYGAHPDSDEQGIVVCGKTVDGRGVVLADRSCQLSPGGWARRALDAYREFDADYFTVEVNFGGAMVRTVIETEARALKMRVVVKEVRASRGKVLRAEPISTLYEQARVSHVGSFPQLEDQMCLLSTDGYAGSGSPDRADALVWALSSLMLGAAAPSLDGLDAGRGTGRRA